MVEDNFVDLIGSVADEQLDLFLRPGVYFTIAVCEGVEFEILKSDKWISSFISYDVISVKRTCPKTAFLI